jgi:hypothetical protein
MKRKEYKEVSLVVGVVASTGVRQLLKREYSECLILGSLLCHLRVLTYS